MVRGMTRPTAKVSVSNILGKWKLNSIQGNSANPSPMPRNLISTFSAEEDAIHYAADIAFLDGCERHVECSFCLDGQSYELKGSSLGDQISAEFLDANSFRAEIRRDGFLSARVRIATRRQGKVLVMDWDLVPEAGPTISFSTLADRVG